MTTKLDSSVGENTELSKIGYVNQKSRELRKRIEKKRTSANSNGNVLSLLSCMVMSALGESSAKVLTVITAKNLTKILF